ncbi:hypothetical protein BDL97_02G040400 [Sphagnum fallax]|nr:hypothetical protein BDL97_02G040400 [Sphagnum fallax]
MTGKSRDLERLGEKGEEDAADEEPFLPAERTTDEEEVDPSDERGAASSSLPESVHLIQICRSSSAQSKGGDIDLLNPNQLQCRICLDSEGEDELISPCLCRGTQKFVHRSCLDNWRAVKEGFAFAHCTECRASFHLRTNMPPDRWWLRLKFQLLVVRDHALLFIVVQMVVASMGMLVYVFYGDELREMFGYEQHPISFYSLAIIIGVLVGLLYGFFIAIICGQRISNRHYHILAKQALTREYVVVSLGDNEEAPSLDRGHINELRMLGLY